MIGLREGGSGGSILVEDPPPPWDSCSGAGSDSDLWNSLQRKKCRGGGGKVCLWERGGRGSIFLEDPPRPLGSGSGAVSGLYMTHPDIQGKGPSIIGGRTRG